MEFLVAAYFIISGILATMHLKVLPESRSFFTALFLGLTFPIEAVIFIFKLIYKLGGIDLNVTFSIKMSEKEIKEVTDAFMKNFSDELAKMEEKIRENDEK